MKRIIENDLLETKLKKEDFEICYKYYYCQSLKNILLHSQGLQYIWLSPLELKFTNSYSDNWDKNIDLAKDPFCDDAKENKILLAKDILKNGNYFPYFVDINFDGLYVIEGKHRIKSLQLAYEKKIIDSNYKVLCIISPKKQELNKKLLSPILSYPLTEYRYGNLYRKHRKSYDPNYVKKDMEQNNGKFLMNEIIVKEYLYDFEQAFKNVKAYPGAIRNILYLYKEEIKPVSYFSDKKEFENWLK